MAEPIIVSTWTWGTHANQVAWKFLAGEDARPSGGGAVDAVVAACVDAENDVNNLTVGSSGYPDASGRVSLDAAIMLDPSRHGAVACVRATANPILLARIVMETTSHRLLVGADADALARQHELKLAGPLSARAKEAWEKWKTDRGEFRLSNLEDVYEGRGGEKNHDTIGVIALDARGQLACATSTSGLAFKLPGRVGDSPIVGAGLYCIPKIGAAVCTGRGELMIGTCAAFSAVDALSRGDDPVQAARRIIERIAQTHQLGDDDQAAILVLRSDGVLGSASIRDGYVTAVKSKSGEELVGSQFVLKGK